MTLAKSRKKSNIAVDSAVSNERNEIEKRTTRRLYLCVLDGFTPEKTEQMGPG